jgi:hypothetical protein
MALAGLGAFHGLNPAMGWLFAVALGLHRQSAWSVVWALPSIAAGHALSIGLVAITVVVAGILIETRPLQAISGACLIGWAGYHALYGHRHRVRVGMQTGLAGLALWSFLMATAHGAGLMVLPALMPLCVAASSTHAITVNATGWITLGAVTTHTGAMLAVTGLIAAVVYRWIGLAILRSAWVNLDLIWTAALVATGALLLATLRT